MILYELSTKLYKITDTYFRSEGVEQRKIDEEPKMAKLIRLTVER
jgi:hypothetical protein